MEGESRLQISDLLLNVDEGIWIRHGVADFWWIDGHPELLLQLVDLLLQTLQLDLHVADVALEGLGLALRILLEQLDDARQVACLAPEVLLGTGDGAG